MPFESLGENKKILAEWLLSRSLYLRPEIDTKAQEIAENISRGDNSDLTAINKVLAREGRDKLPATITQVENAKALQAAIKQKLLDQSYKRSRMAA